MEHTDYKKAIAWIVLGVIGIPVLVMILTRAAFVIPIVLLAWAIYYLVKEI